LYLRGWRRSVWGRDRDAEQPPLSAGHLEAEIEIDLLWPGRKEAGQPQPLIGIER
jgi:hypothetical protein